MKYTIGDIKTTLKPITSYSDRLIDPISVRITWIVANFTNLTPNQVTWILLVIGSLSGLFFYWGYVITGIVFYELAFILDQVDGKIARLKNKTSNIGIFLNLNADKLRVVLPLLGLTAYYYGITEELFIFYLAIIFISTNLGYNFLESYMLYKIHTEKKQEGSSIGFISGGLVTKIRRKLHRYRLDILYTTQDQESIIFFYFPMLAIFFGLTFIKIGYIVAIVTLLAWLPIRYYKLVKDIKKIDRFSGP